MDISGTWLCEIPGQKGPAHLPGTLDENGFGKPDDPAKQWKVDEVRRIGFWREGDPIVTRLTRLHTFEGEACFSRTLDWEVPAGKRILAEVERARCLRLTVNGQEAPLFEPASLSTPYVFELTGMLTGQDRLTFHSDNSYPGLPREAIVYASAASDETQTNWNGLLGFLRIRVENPVFLNRVRVYPRGDELTVLAEIDAARAWSGTLCFATEACEEPAEAQVSLEAGRHTVSVCMRLKPSVHRWNLGEGCLYTLQVSAECLDSRTVSFGVRDFRDSEGLLTLNGRRVFIRGEANCAVFPETGYCPMETEAWKDILTRYRSYGVNCMRFHSHCPPEAAFTAADELGMLMQPELSHWDPVHAFGSEASRTYYRTELTRILIQLANHPSFVMLTFGNELKTDDEGHRFMDELLGLAHDIDGTRLYANGSNTHYGALGPDPRSDFFASMEERGREMRATCDGMRGWLNHEYPNAAHAYDETMKILRRDYGRPVFSFEVGQYEVLPDFGETDCFHGVTRAENLIHIRKKAEQSGWINRWRDLVEATGEASLLCYRAEVEAALRTEEYSGISLLGLQDFPGQGTALVGMMNTHLEPKPYAFAAPERFEAFFRDTLPLVLLPRYTWTAGETLQAPVRLAHYGRETLSGQAAWSLEGENFSVSGSLPLTEAGPGGLTGLGTLSVSLTGVTSPVSLTLRITFCGYTNEYPLWVYPETAPCCPDSVTECRAFDEKARETLRNGGCVYLAPDSTEQALPRSIQAQFSPDFWSVCTFPHQAGGMGQLIDAGHPLFSRFPTEKHNTWQWWPMANRRAVILPEQIETLVGEIDSYAFLRPMAKMFECRCGNGRLLFSSMGLHELQKYPEARALQQAIYAYMASGDFTPGQTLSEGWIASLFLPG